MIQHYRRDCIRGGPVILAKAIHLFAQYRMNVKTSPVFLEVIIALSKGSGLDISKDTLLIRPT